MLSSSSKVGLSCEGKERGSELCVEVQKAYISCPFVQTLRFASSEYFCHFATEQ